jgi:Arc/MetJ-type ribon-helix-helix transcriptional regulator
MIEDLETIASDMAGLLGYFKDAGSMHGLILPTEHSATFKARALEAKSIFDDELGYANQYSLKLLDSIRDCDIGFVSGPSYANVEETSQFIRAGVRTILRKRARPQDTPPAAKAYVDLARITTLQSIRNAKWDFARLAELCRELNVAAANRCHMSTAMLLRTILNHVPPVLGFNTFAEVANNYAGTKSFKSSMQRLEISLRNIADLHLHTPIRAREDVPSAVQVDFAADLDVLLGEVIRLTR